MSESSPDYLQVCPGCKQAASGGERIVVGGVQWHHKCYEATGKLSGPALKTNNISYVEACPVCKNALSATSGERIISGGQTVRASLPRSCTWFPVCAFLMTRAFHVASLHPCRATLHSSTLHITIAR